MKVFMVNQILTFPYTNHRGVTEVRVVRFQGLDFGENEWYPEPQWFLRCYDYIRESPRSFALAQIDGEKIRVATPFEVLAVAEQKL